MFELLLTGYCLLQTFYLSFSPIKPISQIDDLHVWYHYICCFFFLWHHPCCFFFLIGLYIYGINSTLFFNVQWSGKLNFNFLQMDELITLSFIEWPVCFLHQLESPHSPSLSLLFVIYSCASIVLLV
jgi:hypothetical protein